MIYILFLFLIIIIFVNLLISDFDYFNPSVVFNFMFALFSFLCCIVDISTGLEINNVLTLLIICSGSTIFTIINGYSKLMVKKRNVEKDMEAFSIGRFWINIAIIVEIAVLMLMYRHVINFANVYGVEGTFSEKLSFYDVITKFNSDYKLRMPWFVSIGNLIGRAICYVSLYALLKNYVFFNEIDKKYIIVIGIYLVGSLMGGRTEALRIVTAAIFLWYYFYKRKNGWKDGSIKIAIKMVIFLVAIVVVFSLMRGILGRATYDPIKVVFGYMGASIKNLDTFLTNPQKSISNIWGAMTFTKFINWLGLKLGIDSWNYVSDQPFLFYKTYRMGNVYTTYYNFYYDFGFLGCLIFIMIIAIYYCYTYRIIISKEYSKKKIDYQLLMYAYLFNDLIMLPFSSRFYETIVNINFIRISIILGLIVYLINNVYKKEEGVFIKLPLIKKKRL